MDSYHSPTTKVLYRGTQVVWYILGFVEVMLFFRLVLKLLSANADAVFTNFIYGITYIFAAPFLHVFRIRSIDGAIFEWTTLLAMFVYWILALGIINLFLIGKTVSTHEAAQELRNQEE